MMRLIVHFLSDWHIGSGTGIPGSIDRSVLRDPGGLPVIPAKTLTGMLRDGCELVADQLGAPWHEVVTSLFGTQPRETDGARVWASPARLSIRPAHLPAPLHGLASPGPGDPDPLRSLRDAMFFVAPHVKIDELRGCADDKHLFFVEAVRAGAVLEAEVHVSGGELTSAEAALLCAGALAVRRMGGKRRRGLGACALRIDGAPRPPAGFDDWLGWLAATDVPPLARPAPARTTLALAGIRAVAPPGAMRWWVIPFSVHARTALSIPVRTVGNVIRSLDYVPGTLLLPLVHEALGQAGFPSVASAIRAGRIVVTNACPRQADGRPSWPVPLALRHDKSDFGLESESAAVSNALRRRNVGSLHAHRSGYVVADPRPGSRPTYRKVTLGVHMHNTITDEVQRPTEEDGGVFSFEAIPAGTVLGGQLRLRVPESTTAQEIAAWRESLARRGGRYAVGKAKKDDFGWVRVEFDEPVGEERAAPSLASVRDGELTVWLLSDALVRDRSLAWSTDPSDIAAELGRRLGVPVEIAPRDELPAVLGRARRSEGWVRAWELPRPSLIGLAAGSCLVVSVDPAILDEPQRREALEEAIRDVHLAGIGERRAEGFGQLRIQHPLLEFEEIPIAGTRHQAVSGEVPDPPLLVAGSRDPSFAFLRTVEREAWRRAIREAALRYAMGPSPLGIDDRRRHEPPNSQFGTLRVIANSIIDGDFERSRQAAVRRLLHLFATRRRAERWSLDAPLELIPLFEYPIAQALKVAGGDMALIDRHLVEGTSWASLKPEDPGKPPPSLELAANHDWRGARVWQVLFPATGVHRLPPTVTEQGDAALLHDLWPLAVRTLVESVCVTLFDRRERESIAVVGHGG